MPRQGVLHRKSEKCMGRREYRMSNFDFLDGGIEYMTIEDMVSVALRAGDIRKWLKDIEETLIDLAYEKGAKRAGVEGGSRLRPAKHQRRGCVLEIPEGWRIRH